MGKQDRVRYNAIDQCTFQTGNVTPRKEAVELERPYKARGDLLRAMDHFLSP